MARKHNRVRGSKKGRQHLHNIATGNMCDKEPEQKQEN